MLRLGDGGVRSGVDSFDLARDSIVGGKSAAARKDTYLSSTLRQLVGPPSIKQATKAVAALLLALCRVPGAMFLSSRALLCPYYGVLVAIMLFGALEVAVELLVAGDSDRRRGRSKLQGQRKLER
ncbi:hypothetical protein PVAP13_5NG552686 [Panicum virgatum]|uniref:Uncharacterized protein n=1 Tax=Panicum virgatum TaxID=38727 RepID=A0A8T0S6I0_PANVG|nr:hypothetical protein PVAP13_5NG552686 [Panicum virgatum]